MTVRDAAAETLCARLCLLTRAAWLEGLPAPLPRRAVRLLYDSGALSGLVLREGTAAPPAAVARARALLTRNGAVFELLRAWHTRGYRMLLPEDRCWPAALLALGGKMPLFLFAQGNLSLLGRGCVAVAGSRQIAPETAAMARRVGERLAEEGLTLVCGGASGVDRAAQQGALLAGGRLILVPATPAADLLRNLLLCRALGEGRALILTDTPPDEAFSAQRALLRNPVIYALGGAALVLAAREGTGGSWRGAKESLLRGYTPVFVPDCRESPDQAGCRALAALGARFFHLDAPLSGQIFDAGDRKMG